MLAVSTDDVTHRKNKQSFWCFHLQFRIICGLDPLVKNQNNCFKLRDQKVETKCFVYNLIFSKYLRIISNKHKTRNKQKSLNSQLILEGLAMTSTESEFA